MAENLTFGLIGAEDLNLGTDTFTTDLPDGTLAAVLNKINLTTFYANRATASLPAAGTAGRLSRVSDGRRNLWMDTGREWLQIIRGVDVAEFATGGAGTSGSPWTGWDTAITFAANTVYFFRDGYYSYATWPSTNVSGLTLLGGGNTILKHTGSGNAVNIDGTGGIINLRVENLTILGNAATTNGLRLLRVVRSCFKNIRVSGAATAALALEWSSHNLIENFVCSSNDQAFAQQPATGISLTRRNATENSLNNIFINPIIEGVSGSGIKLDYAEKNTFIGGDSRSNNKGLELTANAFGNAFDGLYFDTNAAASTIAGFYNRFVNCYDTNGTIQFTTGAYHNALVGGVWNNITINAGVLATLLDGISYDATLTNNGARTIYKSVWSAAASAYLVDRSVDGTNSKRYFGSLGTTLVAGDFALSAGWGATASISAVTGTDARAKFTVTAAGAGVGANPTITLTFKDGTWTAAPFAVVARNGGSQLTVTQDWTTSATQLIITWRGTPIAAETFTFEFIVQG